MCDLILKRFTRCEWKSMLLRKNQIQRIKHEVVPYYLSNINRIFEIEEDTTVIKYFQDFPEVLLSV